MERIIPQKLFYDGHSYTYSSNNKDKLYYKCTKYFSSGCKSRHIVCGKNNVIKGADICSVDRITEISSQAHEIPPVEFLNNYILEKVLQLELYPNRIY
ncbi:hypothetical protein HZS_7894 [Henneguya salminicola]|nr:hypothetical protein HZS_7894 [Henneguya salminicola]